MTAATAAPGPLAGIRVLDLTRVLAGPYCTMLLADMGAEVIKIEMPGTGDDSRAFGPMLPAGGGSAYFMSVNRGKKSVTVNLKKPSGQGLVRRLASQCDVLVENFRPGTMDKYGLSYDALRKINPSLVYASLSGYGQYGPDSQKPAYDVIIQARSGLLSITGHPGGDPVKVGASIADITTGMYGAMSILGALRHRERTGEGQRIDVAMLDSLVSVLENALVRYTVGGEVPGALGCRHPSITPFDMYRATDGYVVVAIGNQSLWEKFCDLVGKKEWKVDQRFASNEARTQNVAALQGLLNELFGTNSTAHWLSMLTAFGIPCGPVNNVAQVAADPQLLAREALLNFAGPTKEFLTPGTPMKLSRSPLTPATTAPRLGEHTEAVLTGLLKLGPREIELLGRDGVITVPGEVVPQPASKDEAVAAVADAGR